MSAVKGPDSGSAVTYVPKPVTDATRRALARRAGRARANIEAEVLERHGDGPVGHAVFAAVCAMLGLLPEPARQPGTCRECGRVLRGVNRTRKSRLDGKRTDTCHRCASAGGTDG